NHHVEPAFRCQIVVDFQYVPRILPRRFVSRLKPVHFLLVTTIRINIGYDGKKMLAYHFEPALPPALRPPSDKKKFFGPPQLLDRGCALDIEYTVEQNVPQTQITDWLSRESPSDSQE